MIGHFLHGRGPVRAVVLHGWFGDWRVFSPMLPALDPERFTYAFLDYRGYGLSKAETGPFDVSTIAADACALADHLGWDRFAVVGHSMGGKAALRLAADAPERVERVLALAPVWAGPAPFDPDTLDLFRGAPGDIAVREAIIHNTTDGRLPGAWSGEMARQSAQASTQEAFAAYFESWALDDFANEVQGLPHETLVVVGAHDRGVPADLVRATWLANLPNASLSLFAEAGHYPMLEAPPRLAAVFDAFLSGAGKG